VVDFTLTLATRHRSHAGRLLMSIICIAWVEKLLRDHYVGLMSYEEQAVTVWPSIEDWRPKHKLTLVDSPRVHSVIRPRYLNRRFAAEPLRIILAYLGHAAGRVSKLVLTLRHREVEIRSACSSRLQICIRIRTLVSQSINLQLLPSNCAKKVANVKTRLDE
jgi:hypothetical protein